MNKAADHSELLASDRPTTSGSRLARVLVIALLVASALSATALAGGGGITHFLLRANEQPGFTRFGHARVMTSLGRFMRALYPYRGRREFRSDYRRLRAEGFTAAAQEVLVADAGRHGFSLVIELATPRAARAEGRVLLRRSMRFNHGATFTRFRVPGVPTARGVTSLGGPQPGWTVNVYWIEGRCVFGAGDYVPMPGDISGPLRAGVRALDGRIGGRCP